MKFKYDIGDGVIYTYTLPDKEIEKEGIITDQLREHIAGDTRLTYEIDGRICYPEYKIKLCKN